MVILRLRHPSPLRFTSFTPSLHPSPSIFTGSYEFLVVFFQQGDFYNLFGPDADIGVTLGLVYNARLDSVGVNRRDVNHWKAKFAGKGYVH